MSTVRGPLLANKKPLWEAIVEIVDWQSSIIGAPFTEGPTIRHLFLSQREVSLATSSRLQLPGTMLALCRIKKLDILIDTVPFSWTETEDKICHSLLLLQADPNDWKAGTTLTFPNCVCLEGEINLSRLKPPTPQLVAVIRPVSGKVFSDVSRLSVNASGLLLEGTVQFPWTDKPVTAPFWMTPFFPATSTDNRFYLTLDRELMNAERDKWRESKTKLLESFQTLASISKPKDDDEYWTSLVLPDSVNLPSFFWSFSKLEQLLNFPPGEWQVVVADQKPGQSDVAPSKLLIAPAVQISANGSTITIQFSDKKTDFNRDTFIKISGLSTNSDDKKVFEEKTEITNLLTEYKALTAANILRQQYQLTSPTELTQETDPAILWGNMPLADGWVQLPFLNLTEQHYFDALPQKDNSLEADAHAPKDELPQPLLTGAAVFGNDDPKTFDFLKGEHPWSIAILDGKAYEGEWTIIQQEKKTTIQWELTIYEPDLVLNGFLQLGTQTPSEADLLPSLDNFLTDLRMVSLQTAQSDDKFPAPFQFNFLTIIFQNNRINDPEKNRTYSAPILQNWQFAYQVSETVATKDIGIKVTQKQIETTKTVTIVKIGIKIDGVNNRETTVEHTESTEFKEGADKILPGTVQKESEKLLDILLKYGLWNLVPDELKNEKIKTLWQAKPVVWRRHPQTPLIQALPLTQTQLPPNYPSPSRQLAPFQIDVDATGRLVDAVFGSTAETGAKDRVSWLPNGSAPLEDWKKNQFLWLASLGLPGLIFDPNSDTGLLEGETIRNDFLPSQLLYSLPYTDEINALSQPPEADVLALLPGEKELPAETPTLIPRREFYSDFWQKQSERATLARVDADPVLMKSGQGVVVTNLIGQSRWPVSAKIDQTNYPGKATLTDTNTGNAIQLIGNVPKDPQSEEKEPFTKMISSLQGITGSYDEEGQNLLLRKTGTGKYNVVAGTMSAVVNDSQLQDQRGKQWGATVLEGGFMKTPLNQFVDGTIQRFDLWTLLKSELLHLETIPADPVKPKTWLFWFLSLPVNRETSHFIRKDSLSPANEDINDPLADTSEYDTWNGRHWSLADESGSTNLFGFDFFPLTLEKVSLNNNRIQSLELIGRIQLPRSTSPDEATDANSKPIQFPELGNAVRVVFSRGDDDLLRIDEISSSLDESEDPKEQGGIWPILSAQSDTFTPRLHWSKLTYQASINTIHLESRLEFFMFGARWMTTISSNDFTPNQAAELSFANESQEAINFKKITVKLTETRTVESIETILSFRWGNILDNPLTATADLTFDLVNPFAQENNIPIDKEGPKRLSLSLPGNNVLVRSTGSLTHNSLQLGFSLPVPATTEAGLALLPGMQLADKNPCSGFVVMSFTIEPDGEVGSRIRPNYGSLETVFLSEWGEDLGIGNASMKPVFESSAGTICAGYTLSTSFVDGKNDWQSSFLLNGVLSLTNLVSYPVPVPFQEPPLLLGTVLFDTNSPSMGENGKVIIDKFSELFKKYTAVILNVEGHTDNTGDENANLELSRKRAENTKAAFNAVTFTIVTKGFGKNLPIEDNTTPDGQRQNRRAEIYLVTLPTQLKTFFFNESSDELQSTDLLKDLAQLLLLNPAIQIRLEGHANEQQSPADNRNLSVRRADSVRSELIRLGIPSDQITRCAFGQTQSLIDDPEAQENRRVDIHLFYRDPEVILFDLNDNKLNREGRLKLKRFADLIPANTALTLSIEGHTDNTDTVERNRIMASERAEAVKARLLNLVPDLQPTQVVMAGFGETLPITDDDPIEGNLFNRRVEIHPIFSTLPAVRPGGATQTDLSHIRHRIRILFNQHEVPSATLAAGDASTFFSFGNTAAWQFLSTVEHQLVDVVFQTETEPIRITNDRRWTVVQETRIAHPKTFVDYFSAFSPTDGKPAVMTTFPALKGVVPQELTRVSSAFHFKPFLNELLKPAIDNNELTKLENALLIEASTIQHVLNSATQSDELLNLQYLPGGVQQAILSIAEDFAMPVVEANTVGSDWSLLALPFLGRLQPAQNDQLDNEQQPASLLAVDPILFLNRNRNSQPDLPGLLLGLTSRGDKQPVSVTISRFDLTRFRRFKRLDPTTLLESWFRLQHPPAETKSTTSNQPLISVTAALPADSPSRLSRETLLQRLFNEQRETFPPTEGSELALNPDPGDSLSWRQNSLLTWQGLSNLLVLAIDKNDKRPYSFYFAAAQLHSFDFRSQADQTNRYPAVTLLPANLNQQSSVNERPVSFTVSPYLGLGFQSLSRVAISLRPELVFVELLCLDPTGKTLISIASRLWQQNEPNSNKQSRESWAREIRDRLASTSPLGVMRIRAISRPQSPELRQFPRVAYSFQVLVSDEFSPPVLEGTSPLRQNVASLRFTEAHFKPGVVPKAGLLIEYAPPQVSGVQPIYIDQDQWNNALEESKRNEKHWPWGTSGLRFTVNHTKQGIGVVGETNHRLWWSSLANRIQFAYPPTIPALLPTGFKARAILSLLPAAPTLPLPTNLPAVLKKVSPEPQDHDWQPVLPGNIAYLQTDGRAGAFYSFLQRISSQAMTAEENQNTPVVTSGGGAVQYRVPRPVSLPKNPNKPSELAPINALQPWASYFEPTRTLKDSFHPYDNVLVANGDQGYGVEITLIDPPGGILPDDHVCTFTIDVLPSASEITLNSDLNDWSFQAELVVLNQRVSLSFTSQPTTTRPLSGFFSPAANELESVQALVRNLPHGTAIQLRVIVSPPPDLIDTGAAQKYSQTLVFPLRIANTSQLRQPYEYRFIQFEDPEYNRLLVSKAAQNFQEVSYVDEGEEKRLEITFASDRREYNSSSEGIVVMLSSEAERSISGTIHFRWVNSSGIAKTTASKPAQSLHKFSLNDIQKELAELFKPDDSILIDLDTISINILNGSKIIRSIAVPFTSIQLRVEIVKEPVTPVPTSAYALIKRNQPTNSAECVRFAWAPKPARIELLTPKDLQTGIVRRRAIFQWIDTVRIGHHCQYGLQKITSSGSTAFDMFSEK